MNQPTNRNPEVADFDDDFFINGPFLNYEPVAGTKFARITGAGRQPLGGTRLMQAQGMKILPLSLDDGVASAASIGAVADLVQSAIAGKYLDLSDAVPTVRLRPVVDWGFDKPEVMVREEATLANLPPCLVKFTGPVNGTQAHDEAGDLAIGFTTAGTYTLEFEAFPYQRATMQLVVKPRNTAQVDLGVKL